MVVIDRFRALDDSVARNVRAVLSSIQTVADWRRTLRPYPRRMRCRPPSQDVADLSIEQVSLRVRQAPSNVHETTFVCGFDQFFLANDEAVRSKV